MEIEERITLKREIVLNEIDIKHAIKIMMAESNTESLAALARNIDVKETTFRSALNNNSLRVSDFTKISNLMGYEVIVREK